MQYFSFQCCKNLIFLQNIYQTAPADTLYCIIKFNWNKKFRKVAAVGPTVCRQHRSVTSFWLLVRADKRVRGEIVGPGPRADTIVYVTNQTLNRRGEEWNMPSFQWRAFVHIFVYFLSKCWIRQYKYATWLFFKLLNISRRKQSH